MLTLYNVLQLCSPIIKIMSENINIELTSSLLINFDFIVS